MVIFRSATFRRKKYYRLNRSMLDPAPAGEPVDGGMEDGMEGDGESARLGLNGNTGEGVR